MLEVATVMPSVSMSVLDRLVSYISIRRKLVESFFATNFISLLAFLCHLRKMYPLPYPFATIWLFLLGHCFDPHLENEA